MKTLLSISLSLILLASSGWTVRAAGMSEGKAPEVGSETVSTSASVPFNPNEISLNYGRLSVPAIAMTFGAVLGTAFTLGQAKIDDFNTTGAIGLEYFHYFNKSFAVGGSAVFENFHFTWATKNGTDEDGNPSYESGKPNKALFVGVLPGVKWRWLYRPHFGMYTKAGVGAMVQTDDTPSVSFIFQLSPVGMEFGSERVRGFFEVGFGAQGMIVGGIRTAF